MTANPFETIFQELAQINQKIDRLTAQPKVEPQRSDNYLTPEEVCQKYGITRVTLWSWDKKGLTQPIRLGNLKRYRLSDIERLGSNKTASTPLALTLKV